ncbi:LysR family transcriptional regulator [Synechococcus sp. PCC 7336]|uniref:LysR family transcriptional regulator n=1 Tax=Synechococcus sp. PCC 7336 TaxID=195250 RepID=UPI000345082E|nr:LysR family transcriptional regulator [Synechococcus sp. PCC 7336]
MGGLNLNRVKLSQLRALVAVADCHNFSEAALQLEVSQSAISHAIATLESELGVQLLSRGRRGAQLTPAGEQITDRARDILQQVDNLVRDADLHKGLQGGQVRIATFRSVATHVLPEVMALFQQQFPDISVAIAEHNDFPHVEQALHDGSAEVGFTYLPAAKEFDTWEILRDEYVVLLPPQPRLISPKLTWEQLAQYPLILPPETDSCSFIVRAHFEAHQQPCQPVYRFREDTTTVQMVDRGLGAAILPRLAADPIPPSIQICSLPVKLERIVGAAVLADALQTPAVFAFLDTLREWARSHQLSQTDDLSKSA